MLYGWNPLLTKRLMEIVKQKDWFGLGKAEFEATHLDLSVCREEHAEKRC